MRFRNSKQTNNDILDYVMDDWMASFLYNSLSLTMFWNCCVSEGCSSRSISSQFFRVSHTISDGIFIAPKHIKTLECLSFSVLEGHLTNLHKNQPCPNLVITCAILNVVFHLYSCFHCKSLLRSKNHPFFLGHSIFFFIFQCVTGNYSP